MAPSILSPPNLAALLRDHAASEPRSAQYQKLGAALFQTLWTPLQLFIEDRLLGASADEITQQIVVSVLEKAGTCAAIGLPPTDTTHWMAWKWVYQIARNRALDELKRQQREDPWLPVLGDPERGTTTAPESLQPPPTQDAENTARDDDYFGSSSLRVQAHTAGATLHPRSSRLNRRVLRCWWYPRRSRT